MGGYSDKAFARNGIQNNESNLMNCPVNYEEAEERTTIKKTIKTNANCILTKKTVSWKPPGAGASHTPQEYVGRS